MLPKAVGLRAGGGMGGLSALTCAQSICAPQRKHLYHSAPVFVPGQVCGTGDIQPAVPVICNQCITDLEVPPEFRAERLGNANGHLSSFRHEGHG